MVHPTGKVSEEVNRNCHPRNTMVQLLTLYAESHTTHRVTDTDGQMTLWCKQPCSTMLKWLMSTFAMHSRQLHTGAFHNDTISYRPNNGYPKPGKRAFVPALKKSKNW